MAPTVHKLLRFQVLGKVYQFVAMPFGLATAPREFTTLVKEVNRMALRLGISVHMYLDDWLIKANSCQEAQSVTLTLLELTHKLGWIVNREKSDLLPKQVFTFLGQVFDLSKGVCYPTEARFLSIQEAIHPLLFNPLTTPRQVMHLLGLLASTEKLVPQGRLHMRHLQFHLRRNYNCHLKGALDSLFTLDPSVKVHLRWWLLRNNVMVQAPLHPPKYVTSIYTDASAQGWGAHCAHMIAQGPWSTQQSKLHINVLELKAVLLALKTFVPQLSLHQRIIQVASDNTTVCAYINKLGGTRSWDLFALTWHLFAFCRKNKVVLTARHVPGVMNLVADQLSRSQQTLHTEWSLNPKIFRWLSQIDFQPQIDLFATRFNHKLPQYVSPVPDPKALAVDALEMNWSGLLLYSFPPTALCPLVVKKLINSQSCRMLLVAPLWETKEWLQDLMALSIRRPIALPLKENLLKQPHLEVFHQNLRSLNLAILAEVSLEKKGFSQEVTSRILSPIRKSSKSVYEAKWNGFYTWCEEHGFSAMHPTVPIIAEFFLFLFSEKKLLPQTIEGYRSALSMKLDADLELGSNKELKRLIQSFYKSRPKTSRHIPYWDLTLVLQALTKAPFEPLSLAEPKFLTWKTVFLIALASGRRRSEIHAFTFKGCSHSKGWSKVILKTDPAFLAKNQLASEGASIFSEIEIPALTKCLGQQDTEDRSLCPVRALRHYLSRTSDLRHGRSLLFVSLLKSKQGDIAAQTISNWIKDIIHFTLKNCSTENASLHGVKAHDVRAQAASWSFKGGIPLLDIMRSCTWKSHSTFTSFYFRNVALKNLKDTYRLGDIVAAQRVVSLST